MTRTAAQLLLVLAALATIGCDRVTKHVAATSLAGTPGLSYLADTVRLEYAENTGGFLSLGAHLPSPARTVVFVALTGAVLAAAAIVVVRSRPEGWRALGLTLFIAGGASNWFDRIVRGSVVDFLNVGIATVRTGIFNVADVAIVLGLGLVVLAEYHRSTTTHRLPPAQGPIE